MTYPTPTPTIHLPLLRFRSFPAEDGLVRLEYAKGKMAGGTVRARGTIDFRQPPGELNIDVTAEKLNVKQLPKDWTLPPGTAGTLSGDLRFRTSLDKVKKEK